MYPRIRSGAYWILFLLSSLLLVFVIELVDSSSSILFCAEELEEEEDHQNEIVSILQSKKLTPVQKIKKIFSICTHASRIFVVASVAHGLVSYNMSQVLSTAVQNFCRMTDYAQPYQAAGGLSSIADPMVMRVPKISLFFGISDGIFWGMITTLVTMWR